MKSFTIVKDLHDYLGSANGGGYSIDIVAPGNTPANNNNIKLMYTLLSITKPVRISGGLDEELLQLTVVAPKNNKTEIEKLVGVTDGVRKFILSRSYNNIGVIMGSGPIKINYIADGLLPAIMLNIKVNYKQ